MARILVVDDARSTCKALTAILSGEGHSVRTATSGAEALSKLGSYEVDLVLCDVKMPRMDGVTVLRHIKALDARIGVVMISGHQDIVTAVEAMRLGAMDYLLKPVSRDDVLRAVQKALDMQTILVENVLLKHQVREQVTQEQAIGTSPVWRRVCQMVEQVAPSQATILLTGESGTGKEVIATLLHRLSTRAAHPMLTINAAAMPASLLEAELFGYEKGAFTGALQRKPGYFELADGGTLFLDEIGDMPFEVQAKLLRVLQDGTFMRLGGTRTLQVDVRMIAATNKDLRQEVAAQHFRQDLYYRLNVIAIHLPPLRERRADIPLLAAHFLRTYAQANGKEMTGFQQEVLRRLQAYDWPGNVRELANVIERAVILSQGTTVTTVDVSLDEPVAPAPSSADAFVLPANATLAEIECQAIIQALQRTHGNRQAAARQLAIGPATLYRKFKTYQIE